uniref:Putative secreted peptide n=1 Tax=Anopheles braziliensis TaxID=58242 RepID=A0A2M3ZNM2_9DIPT
MCVARLATAPSSSCLAKLGHGAPCTMEEVVVGSFWRPEPISRWTSSFMYPTVWLSSIIFVWRVLARTI